MSKTEVDRTTEEKQQKTFSLENILNVDTATYCASVGKQVKEYHVVPIRSRSIYPFRSPSPSNDHRISDWASTANRCPPDIIEEFAGIVPQGTEKITDYREEIAMNNYAVLQYATGTALIPKK